MIVHATGGVRPYQFSIDGTNYQTDSTFTGLAAATYTVSITDANGCMFTGTEVTITEPAAVTVETTQTNIACNGEDNGTITITATGETGPFTYSIDGTTYQSETLFSDLAPATYPISVQDNNGCTWTTTDVTITEPEALAISSVDVTEILCNGDDNATITINATGGTEPYQYSLNGTTFQTEATFNALTPATYQIHIKDANDCAVTGTDVTITEPNELTVTVDGKTDLLCNGVNDGSITLSATGGTTPYEFSVDSLLTQHTNSVFTDLPAGEYDIFVVDNSGCIGTAGKTTLTQPDTLKITLVSQTDITTDADGEVEMGASGGTAPYTFTLQPEGTSNATGVFTFTTGEGGIYTVELVDDNTCGPKVKSVQIADLTNITEMQLVEGVIYPNPSTGQVTIEIATDKPNCCSRYAASKGEW